VLDREVLAERTNVDELVAVGREAERPLARQQRPLADGADVLDRLAGQLPHGEGP
jgi:hypothetical protein